MQAAAKGRVEVVLPGNREFSKAHIKPSKTVVESDKSKLVLGHVDARRVTSSASASAWKQGCGTQGPLLASRQEWKGAVFERGRGVRIFAPPS